MIVEARRPRGVVATVKGLRDVRRSRAWAEWRALTAAAPPFLTPEFFALTAPLAEGEPLVAEARDATGRLVGVLPLARSDRTLLALRSDHTPSVDYVGTPEGLDAIWATLQTDHRWDTAILKGIATNSLLATRLRATAEGDGAKIVLRPDARHLYLELPGFESKLSAKFAANLRRCARKVGGVVLEKIYSPRRADFAAALAIEGMAWKEVAGTSIAKDPRVARLYDALLRVHGRDRRACLAFLRAGGERIATLFFVEDARTLYALKLGYDPRFANVSPGHLIVEAVAADAEKRGLTAFDFVGREDDWKHKWTSLQREHVTMIAYRASARGLALYTVREKLEPRLREHVVDLRAPLRTKCQRFDVVGAFTLGERVKGRVHEGLGIRSGIRRLFQPPPATARLGEPSRYEVGAWVRVLDADRVRATLDAHGRLRGLQFVPTQWQACGNVYKVAKIVRRMQDDHGRPRAIARTVLLEGVTCAGAATDPAGCGRHCPLMFRDDWLEPAVEPKHAPPVGHAATHAHVRDLAEIRAGLDVFGRRDGVTFMPEMAEHAGHRFRIAGKLPKVFEYDRWVEPRAGLYILDGVRCGGTACGDGPCDRACSMLWHEDWLVIEPDAKPT